MGGNKPFALVLHNTQNIIILCLPHILCVSRAAYLFLSFRNRQMLEVLNLIFCNHSTLKMDNERNLHD